MSNRKAKSRNKGRTQLKGGATMWQRLNYFESDVVAKSEKLHTLVEWLEHPAAQTPERLAAAARFLRRLLGNPAIVKVIDARPKRGRRGSRKGEDVALYLHVCRLQEGAGGYAAAFHRTMEAWNLKEKTLEEYWSKYSDLAADRLADVRGSLYPAQLKALENGGGLYDTLLKDIIDDHTSSSLDQWRFEFLRDKDEELSADPTANSQIDWQTRRAIDQELQRFKKRARSKKTARAD